MSPNHALARNPHAKLCPSLPFPRQPFVLFPKSPRIKCVSKLSSILNAFFIVLFATLVPFAFARQDSPTPTPQAQASPQTYQPKFHGDPARSDSEAAALAYMRVVLRAQRQFNKQYGHFATSLAELVHSGSFTKRMVNPKRGDYDGKLQGEERQLRPHHDPKEYGRPAPFVLCGRRRQDSRRRNQARGCKFSDSEVADVGRTLLSSAFDSPTLPQGNGSLPRPSPCVSLMSRGSLCTTKYSRDSTARKPKSTGVRSRPAPETHRDHHGRQRTLGQAPPHAARGRTSCRSDGRTFDGGNRGAHRYFGTYTLRIFRRELEKAPYERGGLSDGAVEPLFEGGSSHPE